MDLYEIVEIGILYWIFSSDIEMVLKILISRIVAKYIYMQFFLMNLNTFVFFLPSTIITGQRNFLCLADGSQDKHQRQNLILSNFFNAK